MRRGFERYRAGIPDAAASAAGASRRGASLGAAVLPAMALGAALLLAAAAPAAAQTSAAGEAPGGPSIVVTGTGEAAAKPDRALVNFTVLRTADTARAALDAANVAMADVAKGMRALGIEDRDLQTSGFSISPQYRYDNGKEGGQEPPTLVGYEVRNSLTVRVRDLKRLGEILDRAVSLGVNQGGDISFEVSEPTQAQNEARREAVADARQTAEVFAKAAGVTLGAVRAISDEQGSSPPVPLARSSMKLMSAQASSVPVETGETSFTASVRMVFGIDR